MSTSDPRSVVSELRARIARLEGRTAHQRAVLPFGVAAIDRILPEGGLLRGALHEVAGGGKGSFAGGGEILR